MEQPTKSILMLTESCISKFKQLLAHRNLNDIEVMESRLADFNLWADGIGALAKAGHSLDSRLGSRPKDLELVKNVLCMLADSLEYYETLLESHKSSDEGIQNIDYAIKNLALIGVAIRRTGKASRNRRAERTFDAAGYQEFKDHLECIICLRPSKEALFHQAGTKRYVSRMDTDRLSDLQKRLIEANLRRRHNFVLAQERSNNQNSDPTRFLSSPSPETASTHLQRQLPGKMQNAGTAQVKMSYRNTENSQRIASTISGLSRASTAEGSLQYTPNPKRYTAQVIRTQITQIASDADFPRAPRNISGREISRCPCCRQSFPAEIFMNPKLWKQHIIEDLCPYTCIAENCPTPQLTFTTRKEWERHFRETHTPHWKCLFCEDQDVAYETMESISNHIQIDHKDELLDNTLSALLSWCAVQKMGLKSCPLCSSYGPEDSPELVDHVLRHAYEFALRALPWPQPPVHDLNVRPGHFRLPEENAESLLEWIRTANHENEGIPMLNPSKYDNADHSTEAYAKIPNATEFSLSEEYFDDRSEDKSSRPQVEQSSPSTISLSTRPILVRRAAFSSDCRRVVVALDDTTVRLWNIKSGASLHTLLGTPREFPASIKCVTISQDSHQIVSTEHNTIDIWDVATGQPFLTLEGHSGFIRSVAYSPDCQSLASASDDMTIKLWRPMTGECYLTLEGHSGFIRSVAYSPDCQSLASVSDDMTIKLWRPMTGECYLTLEGHSGPINSVAYSPDGNFISSASDDKAIKLWTPSTGECYATLEGHEGSINHVAIAPDSRLIASADHDTIHVWDPSGVCIWTLSSHDTPIISLAFSPDLKTIVFVSEDNTISFRDLRSSSRAMTFPLVEKLNLQELSRLLHDQSSSENMVTESLVMAAAENEQSGDEMIALLLDQQSSQFMITESIMVAAARNEHLGKEIIRLLINQRGSEVIVTESIIGTAAENEHSGQEIIGLLLHHQSSNLTNPGLGRLIRLLLDHRGSYFSMTEGVVKAAAANEEDGAEVIKLLLDQRGQEITVTEDVMKAAAANENVEVIKLLLDQRGQEITITENVVIAAAANENAAVIKLLLHQRGHEIKVTDDIVKAAADNNAGVSKLLLDWRGHESPVTEEVVKAMMTMEDQRQDAKTLNNYTVAIVCAIEFEMSAVRYMLDEEHPRLPSGHGDSNNYILGKLCGHHVVLACLPGNQGKSAAAIVATNLDRTFPSIKWRFLAGIGGGVPSERNDIRLGDVVVSMPEGEYGGLVQYDLGKDTDNGFRLKGFLTAPPSRLRSAVNNMRSDHRLNDNKIEEFVTEMLQRGKRGRLNVYRRPAGDSDILFDPDYAHPPDQPSCNLCDRSQVVARLPREWEGSEIHYGLIASGDRVMRSAVRRDLYARNFGDILCFEMEAAGLATDLPYIVIRGISDYADSHKNDAWQHYAAAAAAAVTKEFLKYLEPEAPERSLPYDRHNHRYQSFNHPPTVSSGSFRSNFTGTGIQNVGTGNFTVGGNMNINDGHASRR